MDAFDLLVVNGLVVTASDTARYDIAIKDGKIALLAPPGVLSASSAKRVIDAEGGPEELIAMSISKSLRCLEAREEVRTTLRPEREAAFVVAPRPL